MEAYTNWASRLLDLYVNSLNVAMGHIIELDLYMGLIGLVLVWPRCLLHWASLLVRVSTRSGIAV